jgi:tRNA(Ile)-lysidine synthase TilS/MesJ
MERYREIEKSIIKKYRKTVWSKFVKAVKEYKLINENDKIAVCISGGKDSFILAKCMQELQRHGIFKFGLEFICMDPGYTKENRQAIEDNAKLMGIDLHIFNTEIFDTVYGITEGSPCYLCARMRRGYLYKYAQKLGCNKIALGHHFDDVIETILLSMFYGGSLNTMMPKLHSTNHPGMELIRPLYLVREEDIISWCDYNNLKFLNCACRFTELCSINDNSTDSKRLEMKELIKKYRQINPYVDKNIFRSVENVNLETIISYKKSGEIHSFLDEYEQK